MPAAKAKKAEAPKAAEITETLTGAYESATEKFATVQTNVRDASAALYETSKASVNGVVEFDKALFKFFRAGVDETVEHARTLAKAPNFKDVIAMQTAFVKSRLDNTAAQTKELVELAHTKTEEALSPVLTYAATATAEAEKAAK